MAGGGGRFGVSWAYPPTPVYVCGDVCAVPVASRTFSLCSLVSAVDPGNSTNRRANNFSVQTPFGFYLNVKNNVCIFISIRCYFSK